MGEDATTLTDTIAAEGGMALAAQLNALMALQPMTHVLYALVQATVGLVMVASGDRDEAARMLAEVTAMVDAGVDLNWHRHAELRAALALVNAGRDAGRLQ